MSPARGPDSTAPNPGLKNTGLGVWHCLGIGLVGIRIRLGAPGEPKAGVSDAQIGGRGDPTAF